MYADPKHIRDHIVKVRLNDAERRLLDALAEFNGSQPATFAREMLLEQMAQMIPNPNKEQADTHNGSGRRAECDADRAGDRGTQAGVPQHVAR